MITMGKSRLFSLLIFIIPTLLCAQPHRVSGELLIQVKPGQEAIAIVDDLSGFAGDLKLEKSLSRPLNIYLYTYNEATVSDPDVLLREIRLHPAVSLAQFNHHVEKRCLEVTDPIYPQQWHHRNDGLSGGSADADIDSDRAWEITTGGLTAAGDTIVVCVIEGGNLNHVDLNQNAWVNSFEIPNNDIDDDNNGYVDDHLGWNVFSDSDDDVLSGGHGTQVMGMIGAEGNNGIGVIGANWNVKIMSVAGEDLDDEASVVEAYTYPLVMRMKYNATAGDSGAFVVATNASWGIDFGNPSDYPLWSAIYDSLGVHGILNCAATSNFNVNVDEVGDIPTAVPSDYMISVTATNDEDVRTFSGYGLTTIDLGAPGEDVVTTSGLSAYSSTSGTSFASPLTAGVIGLLYSAPCPDLASLALADPQASAIVIREALLNGTDPVADLSGKTVTGGRLNAYNSLRILMENCPDEVCLAPMGLEYSLSADTIYTFNWTALSGPITLRFRAAADSGWTVVESLESNELILDTLRHCTTYEFQVRSDCQPDSVYSSCLSFDTGGCCVAPSVASTPLIGENSAQIVWASDFGVNLYEVYFREDDQEIWTSAGTFSGDTTEIAGLASCTEYEFLIHPACSENPDFGLEGDFQTKGCGACLDNTYCASGGGNTSFEYIESVEIGDISIPSGNNGGYELFEDFGLILEAGETYPITLTPGFVSFSDLEFFAVWLDADQDGLFSDDEVLFESEQGSEDPVSGEITIPGTALLGSSRMRVSMKYVGDDPDEVAPCELFDYGETEDYCLTIDIADAIAEAGKDADVALYPNPTSGRVSLDLKSDGFQGNSFKFIIYDIRGTVVFSSLATDGHNEFELSSLSTGLYLYRLTASEGLLLKAGKIEILPQR